MSGQNLNAVFQAIGEGAFLIDTAKKTAACIVVFIFCFCAKHEDLTEYTAVKNLQTAGFSVAESAPAEQRTEVSPAQMRTLNRGEEVMKAFAAAYPDRIGAAEFRNEDWAVPVYGKRFYYAGGRLLPEELLSTAANYDPQPFYSYHTELPEWKPPDDASAARFKNAANQRQERPSRRSYLFFDTLLRAGDRDEAYKRVKSIRLFGWNVLVHYSIMEELALVEERINASAENDPEVKRWLANISSLSGWNWRGIADTGSRSFHAYGTAIDIVMKPQPGKETYWLWSAQKGVDWWNVSYSNRLHPPNAVIEAFEAYGFVWGGKWLFFDTMHFEYRPEIFILNRLPMKKEK
ncbi:MAG: M15 family metallopeptidase [Treponema sp.]|nr:M15 family metallopeptidase [Treponema sp.]